VRFDGFNLLNPDACAPAAVGGEGALDTAEGN
jgi:hypothetical protein